MLSLLLMVSVSNFPRVEVRKIHDGDTFQVDIPEYAPVFGDGIPVRVQGIDTAEMRDKRACARADAEAAKVELESLIEGQRVDLLSCIRDKYFRVNCRVVAQGIDVSAKLISLKLAVPYNGDTKPAWICRKLK